MKLIVEEVLDVEGKGFAVEVTFKDETNDETYFWFYDQEKAKEMFYDGLSIGMIPDHGIGELTRRPLFALTLPREAT